MFLKIKINFKIHDECNIKILNTDRIPLYLQESPLLASSSNEGPIREVPSAYGSLWFSWIYPNFNVGTKFTNSNTGNYTWGQTCLWLSDLLTLLLAVKWRYVILSSWTYGEDQMQEQSRLHPTSWLVTWKRWVIVHGLWRHKAIS